MASEAERDVMQESFDGQTPPGVSKDQIVAVLRTVYDPEIPVSIYDMGLIYDINIAQDCDVHIRMTLTSPACPVAGVLPGEVQKKVQEISGVGAARVELVWDPPWTPDMMSEAAKLQLNIDGASPRPAPGEKLYDVNVRR